MARWAKKLPGFMDHSEYIKALLITVDAGFIKKHNFRILFDPVNGCAVEVGKQLFSNLGEVVMINDRLGQRPARASEPRRETLAETAKQVVSNHCDLGIATDVDADRVVFIDEKGMVLSEDLTAVILAEGKKTLVTPVNSSGLFKNEAKKWGAKVIECRVGPPEIIAAIKKYHADFAYEESGKYFFADKFLWADGLMAGVQILQVMARKKLSLSEMRQQYPVYYQEKIAIKCGWDKMPKKYVGKGIKEIFRDGFRFIRASGTEPLIRVFSDSPSLEQAKELVEEGKKIVEEELSV